MDVLGWGFRYINFKNVGLGAAVRMTVGLHSAEVGDSERRGGKVIVLIPGESVMIVICIKKIEELKEAIYNLDFEHFDILGNVYQQRYKICRAKNFEPFSEQVRLAGRRAKI